MILRSCPRAERITRQDASLLGESDLSSADAMDTPRSSMITAAYLEHLTAADLHLLRPDWSSATTNEVVASADQVLEELLGSTRVFESVFAGSDTGDPLLAASPFLVFAVAVHRSAADLNSASYVSEWLGSDDAHRYLTSHSCVNSWHHPGIDSS